MATPASQPCSLMAEFTPGWCQDLCATFIVSSFEFECSLDVSNNEITEHDKSRKMEITEMTINHQTPKHISREWVSPAAVTYLIHRMVETEGEYDSLLAKFNVFVLPMVNPDGYEYSRQHDRMWRKTRSRTGGRNLFGDVSDDVWLFY